MNWPSKRYGHAAAFVCNSFLLIMGREESAFRMPICDFWMYDLTKMTWVKVLLTDVSYKPSCSASGQPGAYKGKERATNTIIGA